MGLPDFRPTPLLLFGVRADLRRPKRQGSTGFPADPLLLTATGPMCLCCRCQAAMPDALQQKQP
jgi:hypothetical protein